ncbi:MAG: carboxypeptidase-like regulatory domain-containing protein, partial [Candidatus Dadabacteria bacterium]
MEKKLLALVFLVYQVIGFAQEAPVISGRITDQQTSEALDGASVSVKGSANATETDREGHFILQNATKGRIVLVVSHIGYTPLQWSITVTNGDSTFINLSLIPENRTVEPVVISASRRVEKITNAPTSIQVISMKDLEQFAGSNVTELVSKVQGVEYTRAGVDDITFNARGLHSAFNNKVFQLVDGRNSMASASAGLALFNNGSTIKDDIEQIEILLGPQSALYGPNAHNALFNYITKDPRKYPGTSISSSVGSQSQFSTRFRHAVKINEKWAYKVSAEHATGKDYEWRDSVYAGNGTFFGPVLAIPERIPDFSFKRNRGEAHVYYSLTPKTDII